MVVLVVVLRITIDVVAHYTATAGRTATTTTPTNTTAGTNGSSEMGVLQMQAQHNIGGHQTFGGGPCLWYTSMYL